METNMAPSYANMLMMDFEDRFSYNNLLLLELVSSQFVQARRLVQDKFTTDNRPSENTQNFEHKSYVCNARGRARQRMKALPRDDLVTIKPKTKTDWLPFVSTFSTFSSPKNYKEQLLLVTGGQTDRTPFQGAFFVCTQKR
ncbi:Hypothetical predicted protein [Pelobates cultripes]|uniref:Uncharacterized protein n=1 Tax=Pelobates cultripes TaxID=61616 RepID=A0AAD1VJH9_PELCU|nr:Hypothetical predicted protein [Pelobates cultripes]